VILAKLETIQSVFSIPTYSKPLIRIRYVGCSPIRRKIAFIHVAIQKRRLNNHPGISRGQPGSVRPGERNSGSLTIKGFHKFVKNIQAKRVDGFQAIRVNVKGQPFFGQFFYGVYQFIRRGAVKVARQFQTNAVSVFINGDFEI
jgi:hypothetical protein